MKNRKAKLAARWAAKVAAGAVLIAVLGALAACGSSGATPAATPAAAGEGAEPVTTVVLTPLAVVEQPVSPLQGVSALPTPTPQQRIAADSLTLEGGKSALIGRVISWATGEPLANVQLRLGEVFCPEGATGLTEAEKRTQCAVILDDAWNPFAQTDAEGRFSFVNIEARDYTFMVGYESTGNETSVTAINDQGDPIIYTAIADETVDLGDVAVDYQP